MLQINTICLVPSFSVKHNYYLVVRTRWWIILWSATRSASTSFTIVLAAESSKSLLLGLRIDICCAHVRQSVAVGAQDDLLPIMKATMLKNGTQVCSGKNFCANARQIGDVTQLTFMTGQKPAFTVARTWWKVRAPAMMAMNTK